MYTPKRQRSNSWSDRVRIAAHGLARSAGGAAMSGLHGIARNLGSDFSAAAGRYLENGSHAATSAMRAAAERMAAGMGGGAAMDIGESSFAPAQLIPGRGAELSYQQLNILKPIKFSMGESVGPPLTDAYGREKMLYKGQNIMHAFAYKMQLPAVVATSNVLPKNRFVVHNVFRHVLAGPNNTTGDASKYGKTQVSWNETLGPDKSFVRKAGATTQSTFASGSAYNVTPASLNLNDTLQSPFRYPKNGEFMYSRLTRQLMENLGWNANPMKVAVITTGLGSVSSTSNLQVYANAQLTSTNAIVSQPNLIPVDYMGGGALYGTGPSYQYRSQFGRGQVSYSFNNDGTNPVVVDIVITRIKKNCSLSKFQVPDMITAYQTGYMNYSYANAKQSDLQGQEPAIVDVTTNARGPFLPAKALTHYKKTTSSGAADNQPFKQIARDQFIISAGSTRQWSTYLQSMDYCANKFAQSQVTTPAADTDLTAQDDLANCLDEYSYIFSIGLSGVPAPYVEFAAATVALPSPQASVIDRRGNDCSVSVTGAYKESCHPVYISNVITDTFINGRLDIPHFGSAAPLTTNDIASIGQATRSASSTTALIGMGAFNTVGGG